jgi:uncharacterized caspase-like protein
MARLLIRSLSVLIGALAFYAGMSNAKAEPRLALVVANSNYQGDLSPLTNPVNDGRLVAATLEKLGFAVTLVTDVDQKALKRAISEFGDALGQAGPTSSALFYYAGHGLQVGGQNYLIPVSAAIKKEADVDLEAVSAETVLRQMEFAAPRTSIVILDACRNNPLARGFRSAAQGLARMEAPNGSYVAYSTAPGQTAADGSGRNSPFASALAAEIVKPGQGIEEAFRNIRITVSQATNGQQTPWDSSSLMASFYFAGEAKPAAAEPPAPALAPAAPAPPAPASGTADISAVELAFWDSVKNSTDPGDYVAYLEKYPDGNFAGLARNRKATLDSKAAARAASQAAAVAPVAAATSATAPSEAAIDSPTQPEPEIAFESPLPDGTVVLSPKVQAMLDQYLAMVGPAKGTNFFAYFYVSENGLGTGQAQCIVGSVVKGFPTCSRTGSRPTLVARMRSAAEKACEATQHGACVMLYSGADQKSAYKTLE